MARAADNKIVSLITDLFPEQDKRIAGWLGSVVKNQVKKDFHRRNIDLSRVDAELLKAHIMARSEIGDQVSHILDFLKSSESPRRISRLSFDDALRLTNEWVDLMNKRASNGEDFDGIEEICDLGDGFRAVKVFSKKALSREGKLMGHCVGSYHDRDESEIYSVRTHDNTPVCTIEFSPSTDHEESSPRINQIKGYGNGEVEDRYIGYVIKFISFLIKSREIPDHCVANLSNLRHAFIGGELLDLTKPEIIIPDGATIRSLDCFRFPDGGKASRVVFGEKCKINGLNFYGKSIEVIFRQGVVFTGIVSIFANKISFEEGVKFDEGVGNNVFSIAVFDEFVGLRNIEFQNHSVAQVKVKVRGFGRLVFREGTQVCSLDVINTNSDSIDNIECENEIKIDHGYYLKRLSRVSASKIDISKSSLQVENLVGNHFGKIRVGEKIYRKNKLLFFLWSPFRRMLRDDSVEGVNITQSIGDFTSGMGRSTLLVDLLYGMAFSTENLDDSCDKNLPVVSNYKYTSMDKFKMLCGVYKSRLKELKRRFGKRLYNIVGVKIHKLPYYSWNIEPQKSDKKEVYDWVKNWGKGISQQLGSREDSIAEEIGRSRSLNLSMVRVNVKKNRMGFRKKKRNNNKVIKKSGFMIEYQG